MRGAKKSLWAAGLAGLLAAAPADLQGPAAIPNWATPISPISRWPLLSLLM